MSHPDPQGFFAAPLGGTGRGVLVLHPWWGLNETIRDFCTRLADEGFVAFAPDLYHGKVATTIDGAKDLAAKLDRQQADADIANAVRFLEGNGSVRGHELAVIGFSLGASFALALSESHPEQIRAVVVFYGTGSGHYGTSKARYLGHFAEQDEYESEADLHELEEALQTAKKPLTLYRYQGTGHWFFERDQQAYNEKAATLAWERTLSFLREALRA